MGDGTDHEFLAEEKLKNSDACITLTGIDEENIIVSLYAKQSGVSKIITKVDRLSVVKMVNELGLDTVVSPRSVISNHIVRFVRSYNSERAGELKTLYRLHEKTEAIEFKVSDKFTQINKTLREMNIKRNVLIGGIVRDGEFILPSGDSKLMQNDRVIVVTTEKHITGLSQILG